MNYRSLTLIRIASRCPWECRTSTGAAVVSRSTPMRKIPSRRTGRPIPFVAEKPWTPIWNASGPSATGHRSERVTKCRSPISRPVHSAILLVAPGKAFQAAQTKMSTRQDHRPGPAYDLAPRPAGPTIKTQLILISRLAVPGPLPESSHVHRRQIPKTKLGTRTRGRLVLVFFCETRALCRRRRSEI